MARSGGTLRLSLDRTVCSPTFRWYAEGVLNRQQMSNENHSILIVDDESSIRSLLTATFTSAGYDVRAAPNVAAAMELCGIRSFDVVLTDVRMPGLTGHDLVRW